MGAKDPTWRDRAACREAEPELFFPTVEHDTAAEALRYCMSCPVAEMCEAFARKNRVEGVWGGKLRGPGGNSRRCVTCGVPVRPASARVAMYPGTRALAGNGQCQTCHRAARNRAYDDETERLLALIHENERNNAA